MKASEAMVADPHVAVAGAMASEVAIMFKTRNISVGGALLAGKHALQGISRRAIHDRRHASAIHGDFRGFDLGGHAATATF